MNSEFVPLATIPLEPDTHFQHPPEPPPVVHLDDPAVAVLTNFNHVNPITIAPDVPIDDALEKMKVTGVRLLLVTDDENRIIGIITSKDIQGERPIDLVQKTRMPRAEVRVEMIMTPQSQIIALKLGSLSNAQVGHVVKTLMALERQHILVVDTDPASRRQRVCGLFSTTQISKQIGKDVSKIATAHSVAEIVHERG